MPRLCKRSIVWLVWLCLAASAGCGDSIPQPRELVVLVGAGEGTTSINLFFPSAIRVRAGDTVTWRINTEGDAHTVTFTDDPEGLDDTVRRPGGEAWEWIINPEVALPTREAGEPLETYSGSGYRNSGTFWPFPMHPDVSSFDTFSMKFDTPGAFGYLCAFHKFQRGTVIVEPNIAEDLPTQEDIDSAAALQIALQEVTTNRVEELVATGYVSDREEKPGGGNLWIVSAGMGPQEAEVLEFVPRHLAIGQGDTVVWTSVRYHAVAFPEPGGGIPPFYQFEEQERGPPHIVINPLVLWPVRPSGHYDGTEFASSGVIGHGTRPGGVGFSLTFSRPGQYVYACPIHVGMVGTVTVAP